MCFVSSNIDFLVCVTPSGTSGVQLPFPVSPLLLSALP